MPTPKMSCTKRTMRKRKLAMLLYAGSGGLRKAPVRVVGTVIRNMGVSPRRRLHRRSLRKPQMTDVGQSGPPHMMLTLAIEMPGWERRMRMAFISRELGETIARMPTRDPRVSPMSFCCRMCATSLRE